jgi:DNA-binding XRE family transcriptional regulator
MAMAKRFTDIKAQAPFTAEAQAQARLENLADDTGVPLLELRSHKDLTQVELARRLAITQPTVSEIERNDSPARPTVRRSDHAINHRTYRA